MPLKGAAAAAHASKLYAAGVDVPHMSAIDAAPDVEATDLIGVTRNGVLTDCEAVDRPLPSRRADARLQLTPALFAEQDQSEDHSALHHLAAALAGGAGAVVLP